MEPWQPKVSLCYPSVLLDVETLFADFSIIQFSNALVLSLSLFLLVYQGEWSISEGMNCTMYPMPVEKKLKVEIHRRLATFQNETINRKWSVGPRWGRAERENISFGQISLHLLIMQTQHNLISLCFVGNVLLFCCCCCK